MLGSVPFLPEIVRDADGSRIDMKQVLRWLHAGRHAELICKGKGGNENQDLVQQDVQ